MKRIEIALLAGIFLSLLLSSYTGFAKECDEVRQEIVRLHILANSDSEEDQRLKLAVRDAILTQTAHVFEPASSKEQAVRGARQHLPDIERIARETLRAQGSDMAVQARLVNMYFATRQYGDVRLPAGHYDAVRVELGKAGGQNWWCVMFPPMCIPAASPGGDLPVEQQIAQLGQTPRYVPKLAVVEMVEELRESWSQWRGEDTQPADAVQPQMDDASAQTQRDGE